MYRVPTNQGNFISHLNLKSVHLEKKLRQQTLANIESTHWKCDSCTTVNHAQRTFIICCFWQMNNTALSTITMRAHSRHLFRTYSSLWLLFRSLNVVRLFIACLTADAHNSHLFRSNAIRTVTVRLCDFDSVDRHRQQCNLTGSCVKTDATQRRKQKKKQKPIFINQNSAFSLFLYRACFHSIRNKTREIRGPINSVAAEKLRSGKFQMWVRAVCIRFNILKSKLCETWTKTESFIHFYFASTNVFIVNVRA